jgi:hypothetical protein
MMRVRAAILGLALLSFGATSADAQVVQNSFQVTALTGYQNYAGGSGFLSSAWTLGATASYFITPAIGLGIWTDVSFPEADGTRFPLVSLAYGDSTTLSSVNQGVDIWNYGAHVKLQLPNRSFAPFALLGGGGYLMTLDPQQQSRLKKESGFVVLLGVGFDFAVTERIGFELMATDHFYPSWDMQKDPFQIYPAEDTPVGLTANRQSVINVRYPDLNPSEDALSDAVHNFSIVAGVSFVPGG